MTEVTDPRQSIIGRAVARLRGDDSDDVAVAPEPSYAGPLRTSPIVRAGAMVVLLFFGAFGGWAACAPLESAAIASGVVSVDTNRKTIQHLEGGIVERIYVRDGDVVEKGQVLVSLEATRARSTLDLLLGRFLATLALESRLKAERDGRDEIDFPPALEGSTGDPKIDEAVAGQKRIFDSRRETLEKQIAVLRQRTAQSREEIRGLEGEIKAEDTQLDLLSGEIEDVVWLVEQGLARKPRLLALQRQKAQIEGQRSRNVAAIARAEQAITEAELRVAELRSNQINEVTQQLRQAQTDLFDLDEQLRAAEDVLHRTQVRAPQDGTVVRLQVHTTGGVVSPGQDLLDIVPSGEPLIIDTRVDPSDIDVVRAGLDARIRLTAYAQRNFVPLEGTVKSVSADRLEDEQTGAPFYRARIVVTEDLVKVMERTPLYPGMQAEVLIVTGERTLLGYVMRPLANSLNRAFREQ